MTTEALSDTELALRAEDVTRIRLSTALEAGRISAAAQADQDDFAAGRIDEAELLRRFRERYGITDDLAAERPVRPATGYCWEADPAHPWWPGYLDTKWWHLGAAESVLRNCVGAATAEELQEREGDAAAIRALTLRLHGIPATFDLAGLAAIHAHLFGDVYPWAGHVRTNNAAQGPPFARPAQITNLMGQVASHLAATDLAALSDDQVADNLARVYHIINVCRPFYAGCGRAQREFVTALARTNGRVIDWRRVGRTQHDFASLRARKDRDLAPLIAMFTEAIATIIVA